MPALKPLYQGKVDTFCAIYAVLNALRLTHGLRALKAREIFNETLLSLASEPAALRAVLEQTTDYVQLVDSMLTRLKEKHPLQVQTPFTIKSHATPQDVAQCLSMWLNGGSNRAALLRFMRHVSPKTKAINRHWTTVGSVDDKGIHLFDSSHDAEAILHIKLDEFVTRKDDISEERLLYIQPETVRLVRLPL